MATDGQIALELWDSWRRADPDAADRFADAWYGEMADALHRPDDEHQMVITQMLAARYGVPPVK